MSPLPEQDQDRPSADGGSDGGDSSSRSSSSSSGDSYDDVLIGPDLNPTRSALDKKVYRQIILKKNGLRAILISDTLAMGQRHDRGNYDESDSGYESGDSSMRGGGEEDDGDGDDDGDDDDSEGPFDDGHDDEDDNADDDGDEGIRKAAAALAVRAGSFHDPLCCQGLAHMLEHMLFMGTDKYPTENAYDAFLQKNGGSDNAYTELEHTLYHFEIPQEKLWDAMDMFSQFFVSPLLLPDAVDRELGAIESEFQLSRNADECRLQQLLCHTGKAGDEHPVGKFSWGNLRSLKEIPEENNVDVMGELRKFYDQFYYGSNMRLVVIGAFTLDELQEQVVRCFSDVPAQPRIPSPMQRKLTNAGTWDETSHSPIADFGMPFSPTEHLGKIYRVVPVKDRHSLSITWQIPPQRDNWRTKPADYVAHLLGHEAGGSLLSDLKRRSWANACYAGVGSGGYENASSHALFTLTLMLSEEGVSHWIEIVSEVYKYVGMLRYHAHPTEGLPSSIYDELEAIQDISHRFADERMPEELVEEIAEDSLCDLPPDRLLDGNSLLFEFNGDAIKDLLDTYFLPRNARIDLMSSTFGQDSDYDENMDDYCFPGATNSANICASDCFTLQTAGEPQKEPHFGTLYWCQTIAEEVLSNWHNLCAPQPAPQSSLLSLPPVNPFIPTVFALKPLPPDDSEHPLIHCSLKICVSMGRKKSWFPASVIDHNKNKGEFLLSFEDEDTKWHKLDNEEDISKIKPDFEGTFDNKSTKFKVTAVPKEGEGAVMKFGDDSDYHVEDGIHFPAIPPPSSDTRLPQLVSKTAGIKMWHLQDRKFKRPIAELRMKIVCVNANKNPFHRACADLFVMLCQDAVTETSYLASICELGSSIGVTDTGFTIRIHGFDHKLLDLAANILKVFFSFCGSAGEDKEELPSAIEPGRFGQCLEMLMRNYSNSGMQASRFCTDIRLRCIRPTIWSASAKADSLKDLSVPSFREVISSLLGEVSVEAFYHGNVEVSDARAAQKLIETTIASSRSSALPKAKFPTQPVTKAPLTADNHVVVAPTKDANEPNTAVEVYLQIGPDDVTRRVLIDLLAHILYEPLFDQLRTKEQFGYNVSCGARWTHGVIGMSFKVVTSCKSAQEASKRIDDFLMEFRPELASMQHDAFMENIVGLAKNKLQMFNSLEEECSNHWNEIIEGRYEWEVYRNEVLCLRSVTKDQLVAAYDEWLLPKCPAGNAKERRCVVVHVIGTGDGPASSGRPQFDSDVLGKEVDERVKTFHEIAGSAIWD